MFSLLIGLPCWPHATVLELGVWLHATLARLVLEVNAEMVPSLCAATPTWSTLA
jgi:hypothetical protein